MNDSLESYFFDQEVYFMQHTPLRAECATLLFIHGLGDSSLNYVPFINHPLLENYNILIPDLLGYGKSSSSNNYSFQYQTNGLLKHLRFLEQQHAIELNNIILIAHSMGALHATLLCESGLREKIIGFLNVEGSITQFGSYISADTVKAIQEEKFDLWFQKVKEITIYNGSKDCYSLRRYYASLQYCRPEAFAQNAEEIQRLCHTLTGEYTHLFGKKYSDLTLPRVYCYGQSLNQRNLDFLKENHLAVQKFATANHFVMTECFNSFAEYVVEFAHTLKKQQRDNL